MTPASSKTDPASSILVVEDEALIALELEDRLIRMGFRVAGVVDTGDKAILAAQTLLPDLVLMDIRLKGKMDGIQAAGRIRDLVNIPVVYLTAHSDKETLGRAKEANAFGYIIKPFEEKALTVAIEMAMYRHSLETCLKASERKYIATLDAIGEGVVATDAGGKITYINPVAEALTGWRLIDAMGLAIEEVYSISDEDRRMVMDNPARVALRDGAPVLLEQSALLISRNRDCVPIDNISAPIKNDRGNTIGAVIVCRDLRERRFAENALQKAEQQLRQARKMEAIGRLAGGIAHDFNNLLTVINGYSDLVVESGSMDDLSMSQVQEIRRAGEQASSLTRQLLAFSRKQMLMPTIVDLNARVVSMESLLHRLIGENILLSSVLSADLSAVRIDPAQLEQVIMNLAVNARDAMPQGGRLTIETKNVEFEQSEIRVHPEIEPGRYVMMCVSDTGCGFDEVAREHLFEPFFTTKGPDKGTGLGLATVYGIVKQSQGYIYAYSEPGAGAAFKIYLPEALKSASWSTPATILAQIDPPLRGTETVLLVEDEESVRSLSSSILRTLGYHVLWANDGEDALRVLGEFQGKVSLLVTDVVMPKMGGPQLVQRMAFSYPNVPVLYLSGYSDEAVFRHGILDAGAPFLSKPFSPSALAAKVRLVLDS